MQISSTNSLLLNYLIQFQTSILFYSTLYITHFIFYQQDQSNADSYPPRTMTLGDYLHSNEAIISSLHSRNYWSTSVWMNCVWRRSPSINPDREHDNSHTAVSVESPHKYVPRETPLWSVCDRWHKLSMYNKSQLFWWHVHRMTNSKSHRSRWHSWWNKCVHYNARIIYQIIRYSWVDCHRSCSYMNIYCSPFEYWRPRQV